MAAKAKKKVKRKRRGSKIKGALKVIGIVLGVLLAFALLHECAVRVSCMGESSGAQIVIGGNSTRCP